MKIKHLSDNLKKVPVDGVDNWDDNELLFTGEDLLISEYLDTNMKGYADIEDVMNDPDLPEAKVQAGLIVSEFRASGEQNIRNRKYIYDSLNSYQRSIELEEEINDIIDESSKNGIDKLTGSWVSEWQEKSEKREEGSQEIRKFISGSLKNEEIGLHKTPSINKKPLRLRLVISILTLSAAAVAGILITLRTLAPADQSELFDSYYSPLNILSPVVRGAGTNYDADHISAVEKYKSGDYNAAASLFSAEMTRDPSLIAPRFYLGLTEEALGNYEQAVSLLSGITGRAGEYSKDTQWYLGLAYLKLDEKKNAMACFESLGQSPGFYQERALKLLRFLK
jgi:TolA-binding protein